MRLLASLYLASLPIGAGCGPVAAERAGSEGTSEGEGASSDAEGGEPVGHNPGGGTTIAEWRTDALWIYLSNATDATCAYAYELPDCGPADHAVWAIGFGIPLDQLAQGEWAADELTCYRGSS